MTCNFYKICQVKKSLREFKINLMSKDYGFNFLEVNGLKWYCFIIHKYSNYFCYKMSQINSIFSFSRPFESLDDDALTLIHKDFLPNLNPHVLVIEALWWYIGSFLKWAVPVTDVTAIKGFSICKKITHINVFNKIYVLSLL